MDTEPMNASKCFSCSAFLKLSPPPPVPGFPISQGTVRLLHVLENAARLRRGKEARGIAAEKLRDEGAVVKARGADAPLPCVHRGARATQRARKLRLGLVARPLPRGAKVGSPSLAESRGDGKVRGGAHVPDITRTFSARQRFVRVAPAPL